MLYLQGVNTRMTMLLWVEDANAILLFHFLGQHEVAVHLLPLERDSLPSFLKLPSKGGCAELNIKRFP
jgi:hypothetical protein